MNRYNKNIIIIILLLGLFACGGQNIIRGYTGEARNKNDISIIKIPAMFDVIYFDSQNVSQSMLVDGATIEMLPGVHKLVLEYDDFWEFEPGNHVRYKSETFIISVETKIGKTYTIGMNELKSMDDVSMFVENPNVWLVDISNSEKIKAEIVYNLETKSKYDQFETETARSNQDKRLIQQAEKPLSINVANTQPKTLEHLKYWWEKANLYEQDDFRRWIDEN